VRCRALPAFPCVSTRSRGFTLIELLIVLAIIGVVLSVAVVGYGQARMRGAEASAISSLHSINQAQFTFMQTCGNGRYAPTLVSLGTPPPGTDTAFLSPDLTSSDPLPKSGYRIQLTGTEVLEADPVPPACTGVSPVPTYRLTADPITPGTSGRRYFGTNTSRVIYADTVTYTEDMPEAGAPPHGAEIK
jgi:prepilin-type N-terminal cleavage/methylation domain-containing protein